MPLTNLTFHDRVRQLSDGASPSSLTLTTALGTFKTFASIFNDTEVIDITIEDAATNEWATGTGTYSAGTLTGIVFDEASVGWTGIAVGTPYIVFNDLTELALTEMRAAIDANEAASGGGAAAIAALQSDNAAQTLLIMANSTDVAANTAALAAEIASTDAEQTAQDTAITDLQAEQGVQDTQITVVTATAVANTAGITANDVDIAALQAEQVTQDASIAATNTALAAEIASTDAEQVVQDAAIALNTAKVSADGSIDTHSDVDVTTVAPNSGDALTFDGTNFVPTPPSTTVRIFDSIADTDSEVFTDGELIMTRSDGAGAVVWVFEAGAVEGDYSIADQVTGYLNKQREQTVAVVLEPDFGVDEVASFSLFDAGFGDFVNDLDPTAKFYYVQRNPASTATQSFESGVTTVIPADDFDWYLFRRTSESTVELMGKPFSADAISTFDELTDLDTTASEATAGVFVIRSLGDGTYETEPLDANANLPAFIGSFTWKEAEDPAADMFEMNGQTLAGGVANYPDLAVKWPSWVVGGDIVLPDWRGRALMAEGALGITSGVGSTYADNTAVNGLSSTLRTRSVAGGNQFNATISAFTNTATNGQQGSVINAMSGDGETRPNAVGLVLCVIARMDVLVTGVSTDPQTAVNTTAIAALQTDSHDGAAQDTAIAANAADLATEASTRAAADTGLDTRLAAVEAQLPDDDTALTTAIAANLATITSEMADQDALEGQVATLAGTVAANTTAVNTATASAATNAAGLAAEIASTDSEQTAQDALIASNASGLAAQSTTLGNISTALTDEIASTDAEQTAQDTAIAARVVSVSALDATITVDNTDAVNPVLSVPGLNDRVLKAGDDMTGQLTFTNAANAVQPHISLGSATNRTGIWGTTTGLNLQTGPDGTAPGRLVLDDDGLLRSAQANGDTYENLVDASAFKPQAIPNVAWVEEQIAAATPTLAINDLSDVDLDTVAPVTGAVLTFDGTNWVPAADVDPGIPWAASEDVVTGNTRVANRNSDGAPRLWVSNSDRTTGLTFDAAEEANWTDAGEAPVVNTARAFLVTAPTPFDLSAIAISDNVPVLLTVTPGTVAGTTTVTPFVGATVGFIITTNGQDFAPGGVADLPPGEYKVYKQGPVVFYVDIRRGTREPGTQASLAALSINTVVNGETAFVAETNTFYFYAATATSGDVEPAGKTNPGVDPGYWIQANADQPLVPTTTQPVLEAEDFSTLSDGMLRYTEDTFNYYIFSAAAFGGDIAPPGKPPLGPGFWILLNPRQVHGSEFDIAQDASVSTTTADTFQPKLSLTPAAVAGGTYEVGFSYGWNHNSTVDDFEAQFLQGATPLGEIHKQEGKDSAGTFGATGSSQRDYISRKFYVTLTTGQEPTFNLNFRTDVSGVNSSIWDAVITFKRVS